MSITATVENIAELVRIVCREDDFVRCKRALDTGIETATVSEMVAGTNDSKAGVDVVLFS